MNILNILNENKYKILLTLSILINLLGILYIILIKNFYKIKLNKFRYNLLYLLEFINILFLVIVFEIQIYIIAKTNTSWILIIISYLNIIFLILLILFNQPSDFKKELFAKITKENIRNSIIFSFPLIFPIILVLFRNEIKILVIRSGYENYFNLNLIPFSILIGYKNINNIITLFIFNVPLWIIIVFIEEYYFRFVLEYRHNKYIEIFSKIKEIEYINYLKENKNHWIKFSFLFAIWHLSLNPIRIIFLFLSSLYDFFYKSKCKSIIFNFLYHFIWNLVFYFFIYSM
jgi:hypothetical protein